MEKKLKQISKLMSLVLRHQPEAIGLTLDENGWAMVDELIIKINKRGIAADLKTIETVVETNDKKRFAFNEDSSKIRASQGHSIQVELNLATAVPPGTLYHGTTAKFVESILKEGLKSQQRQHVHLSRDVTTATAVGTRHGKPVILNIDANAMQQDGLVFYLSENNVWLANAVPPKYISVRDNTAND